MCGEKQCSLKISSRLFLIWILLFSFSFTLLSYEVHAAELTVLKGDVNGDGVITPGDAVVVNKYIKGKIALTPEQINIADMNNDGVIDEEDVSSIMGIFLGVTPVSKPLEVPKGLKVKVDNLFFIELSWDALQESKEYETMFNIYQDDVLIGSTSTTSLVLPNDPKKEYTFTIRSMDRAGNESLPSNSVKKTAIKNYKSYIYNSAGRLMKIVFISGKKIEYTYDANGNLIRTTIITP
ncbi:dockerin type I domain-containing protein [Paenibacillus sp. OK003]|uniref:dockerin type I domain-containing protein n=1 Tax=Paenibacillus sp. OK003 TaxID=1884380 RepID=UPI0008B29927|nr:dockerin type I domain-containing protein [Paenibacillus sp. OK003]SEL29509.1 YD repeat-containing protein [Paenibacillus sp. OK003]